MSTIEQYQAFAKGTAIYPEAGSGSINELMYLSLGLVGEAGEVANKVKKLYRDGDSSEKREAIGAELGDVFWYIARLYDATGCSIGEVEGYESKQPLNRVMRIAIELSMYAGLAAGEIMDTGICEDKLSTKKRIQDNLNDVLLQWLFLCEGLGLDTKKVITSNMEKLSGRKVRGTLGGSGDAR